MSRGYRVVWETASRTVTASDHLKISVSLLGILPEEEMVELLREELSQDGWSREKDGAMERRKGGVRARLEPEGKEISITAEEQERVSARSSSRDAAERTADKLAEQAEASLKERVTRTLTQAEPDIRARLGEAVQRVYVRALKKKAASLGQIESMKEENHPDGEFEMVIKIKA